MSHGPAPVQLNPSGHALRLISKVSKIRQGWKKAKTISWII